MGVASVASEAVEPDVEPWREEVSVRRWKEPAAEAALGKVGGQEAEGGELELELKRAEESDIVWEGEQVAEGSKAIEGGGREHTSWRGRCRDFS